MRRRQVLAAGASVGLAGMAGCLSIDEQSVGTVTASRIEPTTNPSFEENSENLQQYELIQQTDIASADGILTETLSVVDEDGNEFTDEETVALTAWMFQLKELIHEMDFFAEDQSGQQETFDRMDIFDDLEETIETAKRLEGQTDTANELLMEIANEPLNQELSTLEQAFGTTGLLDSLAALKDDLETMDEGGQDRERLVSRLESLPDHVDEFDDGIGRFLAGGSDTQWPSPGAIKGVEALSTALTTESVDWFAVAQSILPPVPDYESEFEDTGALATTGHTRPSSNDDYGGVIGDFRAYGNRIRTLRNSLEGIEEYASALEDEIGNQKMATSVTMEDVLEATSDSMFLIRSGLARVRQFSDGHLVLATATSLLSRDYGRIVSETNIPERAVRSANR